MPLAVKLRKPGVQILLKKNINRQTVAVNGSTSVTMSSRFSGASNVIDMSPYLGEGSVIHTRKSVREDAGSFSVTFQDSIDKDTMDTVYASIEPQDSLELYFAADAYQYAGQPLPLIMRGIVTHVRRRQAMGADGKPVMQVTISGQDYGKILGMFQVFFLPGVDADTAALVTGFPFFSRYGVNVNVQSGKAFVQQVIQDVLNPFIKSMSTFSPSTIAAAQNQLAALQAQQDALSEEVADVTAQAQAAGAASSQFSFSGGGGVSSQFALPAGSTSQDYSQQLQLLGQSQAGVQAQITALQAWMKANANQQTAPLLPVGTDIQIGDEIVSPSAIGQWTGGTLISLLKQYCDLGPWNELYLEDRADAPYLVYRPVPFLNAVTGNQIIPATYTGSISPPTTGSSPTGSGAPQGFNTQSATDGAAPVTNVITRSDVLALDVGRSDDNVANYYWVDAPRFNVNYGPLSQQMALYAQQSGGFPVLAQDPNCNPSLYAVRKMEAVTNMGAASETNTGNGSTGQQNIEGASEFLGWINQRRQQLHDLNVDNVVFESGTINAAGNERVRAGTYLDIVDDAGDLPSQYYVYAVEHTFEVFGNFLSQYEFDRGTNFIDRVSNQSINSSYLSELYIKPSNAPSASLATSVGASLPTGPGSM